MRFVCSTKLWYYCIFCFKTDVVSYYVLKDQSGYKIEFEKKNTKNTPLTSSTNQTNQSIEPTNKETPLLFFLIQLIREFLIVHIFTLLQ